MTVEMLIFFLCVQMGLRASDRGGPVALLPRARARLTRPWRSSTEWTVLFAGRRTSPLRRLRSSATSCPLPQPLQRRLPWPFATFLAWPLATRLAVVRASSRGASPLVRNCFDDGRAQDRVTQGTVGWLP